VGVSVLFVTRILNPWEYTVDVRSGNLRAEMGDLYPRWVGTRELLLHGKNPYASQVSHEIQMAYYGRPIEQLYGEPGKPVIDEQRFAYPIYVVFILAPSVHLTFAHLQIYAAAILAALTAVSVLLWMDVLRWSPPPALRVAIILLVLSSPQISQGLRLRQLGLLVSFLVALGAWCVARNHFAFAGLALALATLKPQMVVVPLLWFFLWSASAWPRRRMLIIGFCAALFFLAGAGEMLLPGWPEFFFEGLLAYRHYIPTPSLADAALGAWFGKVTSCVAAMALLIWAWRNRRVPAESHLLLKILSGFFLLASLALPLLPPFNQALLLLPLLMILREWRSLSRLSRYVFLFVVGWPWVSRAVLLLSWNHLNQSSQLPLVPAAITLFVPFLFAVMILPLCRNNEDTSPLVDAHPA
jgi:hypothetical protein